jgi:hypothetical protein
MFYALVGIPLNLVMFQSIGERLNVLTTFLLERLLRFIRRAFESATRRRRPMAACEGRIGTTQLIVVSMNVSTLVVAGGAWAFSRFEGWSFLDSVYYCVITLTTVGFGDIVALQQDNVLERRPDLVAFSIVFILFGLAVVSAAMNLLVLRFLTMNTVDERRDEELRMLAAIQQRQQVQQQQQQLQDVGIAPSDGEVAAPLSEVKVVAAKPEAAPNPGTESVDGRALGNGIGARMQRLRLGLRRSTGNCNVADDDDSSDDCWRHRWWKRRTVTNGCCESHPFSAPSLRWNRPDLTSASPCWRRRCRYQVTRPPSTIEHLLTKRIAEGDKLTHSNGRLVNFQAASFSSAVQRNDEIPYSGSTVWSLDAARELPIVAVCTMPSYKRISI